MSAVVAASALLRYWLGVRALACTLAVLVLVFASILVPDGHARAAVCVPSVGPGIAPPASVPSGIPGFHAAWYGQSGYQTMCPGQTATAVVAYYNSGSLGWVRGQMGEMAFLGTWNPEPGQDQPSAVGGDGTMGSPATGWPRFNRVAPQPAAYVGPGQIAWFQFTLRAPATPGTYRLALRPLIEGATWMEDYGVFWVFTVLPAESGGGGGGGGATPTPTPTPTATSTLPPSGAGGFVGNSVIEGTPDQSGVGTAEANQFTATTSGSVSSISIYIDASNQATRFALGLYTDVSGTPATLIAQGTSTSVQNGAWNSVTVAPTDVVAGTRYWIARLALAGGAIVTRVNPGVPNPDRVDTRVNTELPSSFSPGASFLHLTSMFAGTPTGGTPTPPPATPTPSPSASCTVVLGFSQTNGWYSAGFETAVGAGANWELRWQNGGSAFPEWADPSFTGWTDPSQPISPCAQNALTPTRAVLNITGHDYQNNVATWRTRIENWMTTTRGKYGNIPIFLQPVVGGPNHTTLCPSNQAPAGSPPYYRASYNHPYINQAIDQIVAAGTAMRGADPVVSSCADYMAYYVGDYSGHLTASAY
ncbi:MAG: hypothetical protein ACRDF9_06280, partial [Candidatus Limnocylindria bacterium]